MFFFLILKNIENIKIRLKIKSDGHLNLNLFFTKVDARKILFYYEKII